MIHSRGFFAFITGSAFCLSLLALPSHAFAKTSRVLTQVQASKLTFAALTASPTQWKTWNRQARKSSYKPYYLASSRSVMSRTHHASYLHNSYKIHLASYHNHKVKKHHHYRT